MSAVDEYIKLYSTWWEEAEHDPTTFLTYLAEEGIIESRMIEPLAAQHRLALRIARPEVARHVLLKGPSAVYDLIDSYRGTWEEAGRNTFEFIDLLTERGYIVVDGPADWRTTFKAAGWEYLEAPVEPAKKTEAVHKVLYAGMVDYLVAGFDEVMKSFWRWLRENVTEFVDMVWGHMKATFEQYWPPVKDKLEEAGRWIYDMTNKTLLSIGEVTPERATELGWKMFGVALGAGITAHVASVGFELVHPFKSLGFHQMTGMIAQLGSFGPVSAATLGQVHYAALRRPMSYAVNKVTRSQLPDDQLLQIMAVKPDIPMDKFIETMKYHGYSDFWIDRIKTTMYHEPRYFELKMMSEDQAASEDWLFTKSRRAGFNEADSRIMVSSYVKSATRTQRLDYYRQAFYLFKEGYIPTEYFNRILDELELRPEAKRFCERAAELAYLLDTIKEEVKYWTDSFLKDIVTREELEVQLTLLGINRWRVDLMVRRAVVRKYKKPARDEADELEAVMSKARTKYSQAYVELYRKDRLTLEQLESYLVAVGIHEEIAQATCMLEEARRATPAA